MNLFGNKVKTSRGEYNAYADSEADEARADLEITHVGPYEILAPIDSGGMGTVYKAIDRSRDQTVAIKVLDRRYDLDKKRRKRDYLGHEILVAAQLQHPNIVRMHQEIIEQEDRDGNIRRCLVMEYINGWNMRKHIVERDLSVPQMLDVWTQLANGLDFLHRNGVVHRDIKPENFLFSRDLSVIKIVDYGLSKASSTWRMRLTRERGGTRRYMSPEQLAKKRLDARSDIFSFGLTIFEFVTGRHPCTGDTKEIMRQIRSPRHKWPAPSSVNQDLPPRVDRVVLKALRREPERRYQSMSEMILDLNRASKPRI